jgi:hypothetical protein
MFSSPEMVHPIEHTSQGLAFTLLLILNLSELMGFRFHYRRYLEICETKGIEPKAHAPEEFQKKNKYVTSES